MTVRSIIKYYADLLILQYKGKPKASKTIELQATPIFMPQTTVETLSFSSVPISGSFRIGYKGVNTGLIAYNASSDDVQTALRLIPGLSLVTVSGSFAAKKFTVTMTGVPLVASELYVLNSTLADAIGSVKASEDEVDVILPIAVQNAFDIRSSSSNPAKGVQLDIIGKYAGVARAGRGISTFVNLNDDEYRLLIRAAIARNSLGSSLADIQEFLMTYFPGQVFVKDYTNMHLGYFLAPGSLSSNVLSAFIAQGLLPKPMTVSISPIIYSSSGKVLFGFDKYTGHNVNASPFNSYTSYDTNTSWLSYSNVVTI